MCDYKTEKFYVDLVMCIDGSSSVCKNKEKMRIEISQIASDIQNNYACLGVDIILRIRFILFGNYAIDGANAMQTSDFFVVGQEDKKIGEFLGGIKLSAVVDEATNGFEAIYYAMLSKFRSDKKSRQIIILLTDKDAVALGEERGEFYPDDMADFKTLTNMWQGLNRDEESYLNRTHKLVIIVPENTKYQQLSKEWSSTFYLPVRDMSKLDLLESINEFLMLSAI